MFSHLILFLGACITSTLAQAEPSYLNVEILPRCFSHPAVYDGDQLYINGQENPLASSLENFISLIEKLELANPSMKLSDELFILLKNYTAENVYYRPADELSPDPFLEFWKPSSIAMTSVQYMWETNREKELPQHIDPFEDNEKCSLFFMLSHTVNDTARNVIDPVRKFLSPSSEEVARAPTVKTHIPREQGVVSINKSENHAVALGRVLLGLYVGLKDENERIKPLESYDAAKKLNFEDIKNVDSLYIVTLADQLVIASYPLQEQEKEKAGLGKNGKWKSTENSGKPISNEKFPICPTVYQLPENSTSVFTYSSVRGGVDGLILGKAIKDIYNNAQQNVRLSQILRMYYGPNGLQESSSAPLSNEVISFCTRIAKMSHLENILREQMKAFFVLVSSLQQAADDTVSRAFTKYEEQKRDILVLNGETETQCKSLKESKDFVRCETATDIIFVLDTTPKGDDGDLQTQREIIGHLANRLDMRYGRTTMTVLSDRRNGTSGVSLMTVLSNTSSSACAACTATQFKIENDVQAEKHILIQSVADILKNVGDAEKELNGVRGKVVIFFNFQEEETVSYRTKTALRNLYMNNAGVQFIAIGNNKDVLKTYTQSQLQNIVTVVATPLTQEIADTLGKKICEIPSLLQYDDCANRRSEGSAVYKGLITPNSIQRWAMYPKYFYKSLSAKVFFQAENRQIEVCHSRSHSRAEDQQRHCFKTNPTGGRLEFNTPNPCKGFNDHNCAPLYFTVRLVEGDSDSGSVQTRQYCQDTNNLRCETLDQVKFSVSHEGIRCSSCFGLFPSPVLLLACFAVYIVNKFINVNI